MTATIDSKTLLSSSALAEELESVKFTDRMTRRLHELMDRNTEGLLNEVEQDELQFLADCSEVLSIFRGAARRYLRQSAA